MAPFGVYLKHTISNRPETTSHCDGDSDEQRDYVFSVTGDKVSGYIDKTIGDISTTVMIDSGVSVNLIDRQLWEVLKQNNVNAVSRMSNKKLFAYGSEQPLTVAGCFIAQVRAGGKNVKAEFFVKEQKGSSVT